ncbi:MAG TPA: hypothetical protein VKY37_06040 [Brumimicrobium sp.]|nr:hypothetical protein [Brumimicrobium sp.]
MKIILQSIAALSVSAMLSIGSTQAQAVTIFEQNGASNQMTPQSWTITGDLGFSTSALIVIGSNETGTLNLNDQQFYKDVTCEIHLNADLSTQFPITFNGYSGGELTHLFTYKQHNGDGINRLLFTFDSGSFSPTDLKEMVFSNTQSKVIKIDYIKITGIPTTASIGMEDTESFNVTVNPNDLIINSKTPGTLNIYNSIGQLQGAYTIGSGENTVHNSTLGMSFLVLTDSNNELISRKKIMR